MGKIIAVVSGKGGTGKTTAVGAIGSCLAAVGCSTLCVDCDADLKNLDISLGLTNYLGPDIHQLLRGEFPAEEAFLPHPEVDGLYFLSALNFNEYGEEERTSLKYLFKTIRSRFDFCLLDAPAGIAEDVLRLLSYADEAIIVATGDLSSLRDAQTMCARIYELGISQVRLLVNRVEPSALRRDKANIDTMIDRVGARLLGIVREDTDVPASANRETALVLYSRRRAAQAFLRIARRLRGEDIPLKIQ